MARTTSRSTLTTVVDPRGQMTAAVEPQPLAPRLDTLEGKTVYIIDVGFGGGWEFLEEARDWISRRHPGLRTVLEHKKGIMFVDEPDTWREISEKGDAVIFGVGG